ncbi:hypothetical protein V5H98_07510 [Georgenia sp. M64]|uniref:hypothetical protein n=1 Tax=Georgenia sp. M64 TaxID=3120520 RepID=UPI0030E5CA22
MGGSITMELGALFLLLLACLVYIALGVWAISAIFPALKDDETVPDDMPVTLTEKEPHR